MKNQTKLWVCLNPRPLNKAIKPEHPISPCQRNLPNVRGILFLKTGCQFRYCQIKVDEQRTLTSNLLTFGTHEVDIVSNAYHMESIELESDLRDTVDWGKKWLVDFKAGKTQLVSFDQSNNNGTVDVKMDGSVLEEKPFFKMLGLTFSSKLD